MNLEAASVDGLFHFELMSLVGAKLPFRDVRDLVAPGDKPDMAQATQFSRE